MITLELYAYSGMTTLYNFVNILVWKVKWTQKVKVNKKCATGSQTTD